MIRRPYFINAIGTPLDAEERLHVDGLHKHLHDQWSNKIDGILVAGTMGLLQLLRDETYRELVKASIEFSRARGEILIGAGDTGFVRTRDRIEFLNRFEIDGVVVLSPYFVRFSQEELVGYYHALADASRHPLYLYHLPVLTKVDLALETVEQISRHPNIRGIKCSCDYEWTRQLSERIGDCFRIIVAQPTRVTELTRAGVQEHLDGIFSLAPAWTSAMGVACQSSDWETATRYQSKINELLQVIQQAGVFPAFSAILNARGITGNFAPAPFRQLETPSLQVLLEQPIVRELIAVEDAD